MSKYINPTIKQLQNIIEKHKNFYIDNNGDGWKGLQKFNYLTNEVLVVGFGGEILESYIIVGRDYIFSYEIPLKDIYIKKDSKNDKNSKK